MRPDTKKVLQLYIQRADELKDGRFVKYFKDKQPIGLKFTKQEDGSSLMETLGPDNDATVAVGAIIRPFLHQKLISFKSMTKLCDDPDLSEDWKTRVIDIQSAVDNYLKSRPGIIVATGEPFPTRYKILNTFFYGHILHIDKDEIREIYERWQSQDFYGDLLITEFYTILVAICDAIFQISAISKIELKKSDI